MQNSQMEDNILDFPEDWVKIPLCNAGKVVTGNTPKTSNTEYYNSDYLPWVTPPDLDDGIRISTAKKYLSREGAKIARVLPKGAVMVSCIGNLGKVGIADVAVATNQQINSIIFNDDVDPEYGFYYCQTLKKWLESNSSSTTIAIINKSRFEQAPFLKPTIFIQKRIVKKLKLYLSQVKECSNRISKTKVLIQKFRQSVLSAAVTGKLTEEWREEHGDYKWNYVQLSNVSDKVTDGDHNPPKRVKVGVPYLTAKNIKKNRIVFENCTYLSKEDYIKVIKRYKPQKNDLLITCVGTLGETAIISDETHFAIDRNIAVIRPKTEVLVQYLNFVLNNSETLQVLKTSSGSSAQPHLYLTDLKKLEFNLPSLDEQEEIVKKVQSLYQIADLVEKQIEVTEKRTNKLTQSILAKAFRGEL